MAQSKTYFGLRHGSTKSQTFSVLDGKQITKDRVEGGKDPRTLPQMSQRCMVATIGSAYSAMKSICDHSFEGKSAGMQCMRAFMSANLKQILISKEYDNRLFGFCKYKESVLVPGCYIISDGSLPLALADAEIDSVNVADKKVTLNLATAPGGVVSYVADAMGCKNFGDICTVAIMYPKADGSYGFGAVRFTYGSGASVLDSFSVAVTGELLGATPSFSANELKVEVRMAYDLATGASADNTYLAAITSRKVNGSWLRSFAQFDVEDATPTFAAAISTYPVGQERFLNGSDVDVTSSSVSQNGGSSTSSDTGQGGSSSQGSSQSQTDFALTITKTGTGTSTVKDDSEQTIESGAKVASGTNMNIEVVPAEGQVPTATLNGNTVELTENDGTYSGSFQMPAQASTLVINSGTVSGDNDDDGLDKD